MSIAVLTQVYAEARRLAVAGSVVAAGDFRLKKLLPPLDQAAAQAPVFAKVAEAARAVTDGPEAASAAALLELTALVSAVLYTQGETGLSGPLEPVETTALGGTTSQIPARVLKPLLDALRGTGSGRLPPIKEAAEQGLFRDLRLVRPAVAAIDDGYAEIADLVAEQVLPRYGSAVVPELRATFDPKGGKGHPRRLELLHRIDPAGSRDLVKQALDGGSKDVKVAAIACLGADPADRDYLTEQAASKTADVREAAFQALAKLDHPDAVAVLLKAARGKDLKLAARPLAGSTSPALAAALAGELRASADALVKLKDKKAISDAADRLTDLLGALPAAGSADVDAVLLDLFARRAAIAAVKGTTYSGADVVEALLTEMEGGSEAVRRALAAAHADLDPAGLRVAFQAARTVLPPAELYDTFAPYLLAPTDPKKKARDPALAKRAAIIAGVAAGYDGYRWLYDRDDDDDEPGPQPHPYDPRWLDAAVAVGDAAAVTALARPDHPGAQAFAWAGYEAALKKAKDPADVQAAVVALLRVGHTQAADAFFAGLAKRKPKTPPYYLRYYAHLIGRLPAAAVPRLEAAVAAFPDDLADAVGDDWRERIETLKAKHATESSAATADRLGR